MQISETTEMLKRISAVDNRKVTPQTVEAWHDIIGRVPLDIATEALKLAQQDPSVRYLEPRHIMGWVKEAAFRLDRNKPEKVEVKRGTPQPRCKDHDTLILECDPCSHRLMKWEEAHGSKGIHDFALAEIYAR
tara:strand:+ start:702 stop:1100 length:399 start_codon:yes stop_codon:yes gene_type:complete